jgi:type IV fimbrial biogenesis protein FimT
MKKQHGFTLVELLITMAIVAIVLSAGVPNFRAFIVDNRLVSQANQFSADINLARSAAIKYQRNAQVCVSTSFDQPAPLCTGGTDWSNGWIVWIDKDRDNLPDAPGEILRVGNPLTGNSVFTSGAASSFTYNSRGFGTVADTLTLCADRTYGKDVNRTPGRTIDIRGAGRLNISQINCP